MYEIWHDNDFDLAHWFYLNSGLKGSVVMFRQIPKTNGPSDLLNHLTEKSDLAILKAIKFETPDLVLINVSDPNSPKIELVIEFMTHTPQHDHPLQRFTRIYGAAWQGIPSILVIPQQKEKLEKGRRDVYTPTMYKANPLIYHLFIKTTQISNTPTLLLMWPEIDGYLKYDKGHPTAPRVEGDITLLMAIANGIVSSGNVDDLIENHVGKQKKLSGYLPQGNDYGLTSGDIRKTKEIEKELGNKLPLELEVFRSRTESFYYSPMGLNSSSSSFRTDPYAGKVCAFDILFCRDSKGERYRNLVLRANNIVSANGNRPTLRNEIHNSLECPFLNETEFENAKIHLNGFCPYTERKQQRIYGEIPDLVVFDDLGIYAPAS